MFTSRKSYSLLWALLVWLCNYEASPYMAWPRPAPNSSGTLGLRRYPSIRVPLCGWGKLWHYQYPTAGLQALPFVAGD